MGTNARSTRDTKGPTPLSSLSNQKAGKGNAAHATMAKKAKKSSNAGTGTTTSPDKKAAAGGQSPSDLSKATANYLRAQHKQQDGPLFFFKQDEVYGEFCQWYPAKFTVSKAEMSRLVGHPIDEDDPEGWQPIYFSCAEQFMMYCKAGRFHDSQTQRQIMATNDPKEQKCLGRLTSSFDADSWTEIKSEVVVVGNMAKFGQNSELLSLLLGTGDRLLAEAASLDRVWGIGYTAKTARANRASWGENRLGWALMEVRSRLATSAGAED